MEIVLKDNERIDDLQLNNLKIIQNKDGFCFGIDAVLLSDFAKDIRNNSTVLDLGTGTGIIGILLCAKTKLSKIYGIDVQKYVCDMALRSIKLNNLEDKFEIINTNIKKLTNTFEEASFDAIVSNPPYFVNSLKCPNLQRNTARHTDTLSLEDLLQNSQQLLAPQGSIALILPYNQKDYLNNCLKQEKLYIHKEVDVIIDAINEAAKSVSEEKKEEADKKEVN